MKILLFDIETAPNLGWVWGRWEQDVIEFEREWYMLCFAAKWLGSKKVISYSLPDFSTYKKDKYNDTELVGELWELLNSADIVVTHNGDRFDIKKTNTRLLEDGFSSPHPYQSIDTLKVAKKYFGFTSNKLDDLARKLKFGQKVEHGGFSLWKGCMNGDMKSWRRMVKYNRHDVILLEKVFLKLRPWMKNHQINFNVHNDTIARCPQCGSRDLMKQGYRFSATTKRQQYTCNDCGSWSSGTKNVLENKPLIKG